MKRIIRFIVICLIIALGAIVCAELVPFGARLYTGIQVINTRAAERADYTKITTPLSASVVGDICAKFEISSQDKRCQSGAVVYGPDFFPDIKSYFRSIPKAESTYQTVQDKLGAYWISCQKPDAQGRYSCDYDLKGDGIYAILVLFTKDGFYYDVIANIGGS